MIPKCFRRFGVWVKGVDGWGNNNKLKPVISCPLIIFYCHFCFWLLPLLRYCFLIIKELWLWVIINSHWKCVHDNHVTLKLWGDLFFLSTCNFIFQPVFPEGVQPRSESGHVFPAAAVCLKPSCSCLGPHWTTGRGPAPAVPGTACPVHKDCTN